MLGNGGHARVCRDVLAMSGFKEIGYVLGKGSSVDEPASHNKYLGTDEWLLEQPADELLLVNGVGGEPDAVSRSIVFDKYCSVGFKFATLIHPSAYLADDVMLGEGAQIMAGAIIQPNCSIASNSIINTRASIDHDCVIHSHVHIAPGAVLCGGVVVGEGGFVGAQACIIPGIYIGSHAVIGAGSTVRKGVENNARFVGK
tara:strand:- start:995 stop:1594 length:600 start_codon:yes stop_codon:yes gene_type:complete